MNREEYEEKRDEILLEIAAVKDEIEGIDDAIFLIESELEVLKCDRAVAEDELEELQIQLCELEESYDE